MKKSNLKIGDNLVYTPRNKVYTITEIDREYNIVSMGIHHCDYRTVQKNYQYITPDGELVDLMDN